MQPSEAIESTAGELTWEIAQLFPRQGDWSEGEYLSIKSSRLLELSKGRLEILAMPTQAHQLIVAFIYQRLLEFVTARKLGMVLFAPLRIKVGERQIREPDIVFMSEQNKHLRSNEYWTGADLVVEVVSADDPKRDLETKRREYAVAGIPEYWIVDPRDSSITVLKLNTKQAAYVESGIFTPGTDAVSILLDGFTIDTAAVFDAANA